MVKNKVFILEDDFILLDIVSEYLRENHFEVKTCTTYNEAVDLLYEDSFDLLILDVNVIGGNGFELLKYLRDNQIKTPAIFMTSRDSIDDLQKGYDSGCDDYIRKPFELKELLFRVNAVIKREKNFADIVEICKDIFLYNSKQQLQTPLKTYELSQKEHKLLKIFIANANIVLSHESLFEKLWAWDEEPSELSLRAYIKSLRKMIGNDCITTLRGSGYRFELS